jgi:hypothetical protein
MPQFAAGDLTPGPSPGGARGGRGSERAPRHTTSTGRGEAEARSERPSMPQFAAGIGCAARRRSAPGLRWRLVGRRRVSHGSNGLALRTSRPAGRPPEGVQAPPEGVQPYAPTRRGRGEAGAWSERPGIRQFATGFAAGFTMGLLAGRGPEEPAHGGRAAGHRRTFKCRPGARAAQGDVGSRWAQARKSRREMTGGDGRWLVYPAESRFPGAHRGRWRDRVESNTTHSPQEMRLCDRVHWVG